MNELFHFRKQLNIARVATVALSSLLIFILALIFFIPRNNETKIGEKEKTNENPFLAFQDNKKQITLTLDKSYGFSQFDSSQGYILELRSEDNLNVFIEKKNLLPDKLLYNIVNKDKDIYLSKFSKSSNISDISDIKLPDGSTGYTYCFHYLDENLKTAFYLQIIWIQRDNGYYIVSIDFPLDKLNSYSRIINDITNNLKFN